MTAAGERLHTHARRIAVEMDELTGLLEQIRGSSETVHLAISHTAAEFVIAVPLGHPWARRPSIVPKELLATPIVLRDPDAHTRQVIDEALTATGLGALRAACEVGSTQAAKDEAHELGLPTAMSRLALAPADRPEIVPVDWLRFQRRFCILHKPGVLPAPI